MAHVTGLTSQEAQERLHHEILAFGSRATRINWFQEILSRPPYILLSTLLAAIAVLLLLLDYSFGDHNKTVIFQAVLLTVLAVANCGLFSWEVYILRTRRIRRLLSRINPLLDSPCPWTATSYPTRSITTLRGSFTVHTYRDGTLVNLPSSLLVRGDVIQLHEGMPTPAKVTTVNSDSADETTKDEPLHLELGETPPRDLFGNSHIGPLGRSGAIAFAPEAATLKLLVTATPITSLLESTVGKKRTKSFLTREKDIGVQVLMVLTITLLSISAVINGSRWLALDDDLADVWPEVMLRLQAYTIIPLLHFPLPVVWTLINLYGTARVVALVKDGPDALKCEERLQKLRRMWSTFQRLLALLIRPSMYPNYRVFHVLGSLTSLCSVDKEYVLTSGYPTPEKVFFLRCTKAHEDTGTVKVQERDRKKGVTMEEQEARHDITTESQTQTGSHLEADDSLREASEQLEHYETLENVEFEGDDEDNESHGNESGGSKHRDPEASSLVSAFSDGTSFEVVTEILDMSPNPESLSGLCFDEVDWEIHVGSLKPIGVNALASSHLLSDPYTWCPQGSTEDLRRYIRNTNCVCPLGVEIGVTEYSQGQFEREILLYSFGSPPVGFRSNTMSRKAGALFLNSVQNVQSHMISAVLRDRDNNNHLLMSRGSGDMISLCCSDFWDGKDLQPMTEMEQSAILDFFNRRSLTSYCVAFAYNPLLEANVSSLRRNQRFGIYVPDNQMHRNVSDVRLLSADSTSSSTEGSRVPLSSAEAMFGTVQCNQVFLGMLSLQFRPRHDIVTLVEGLEMAGIRFVHFTAENEVRGKIFAEKLGLEAGWNCHISLGFTPDNESLSSDTASREFDGSTNTSPSSSLSSVINAYQSYIRAKLPKGIQNIRPHIKNVDNVPLLVPLFTDCTTPTIREMIEVMQENGKVVMCLGNAWNRDNLTIFSQADISLSVIPENVEQPKCPGIGAMSLQSSMSDHHSHSFCQLLEWPSPLEMASHLNSTTCQLSFGRDSDVSVLSLVTESRHILSCARHGLLFALGSSLALSLLMLLSSLFLLPPPLSGSHLFWFLFFVVPAVTLSLLSIPVDPTIKSQMPNRKKHIWDGKWLFLFHFLVTFVPTVFISLLLFALTLGEICSNQTHSDCHPLRGDRNLSSVSPWNGWRGDYEQGLMFGQDLTALFFSVYLVALSVHFVHRTQPIWRLWRFTSWQYLVIAAGTVLLQIIFFVISQAIATGPDNLDKVADLSSVPSYVWVVGFIWPFLLVPIQELIKYHDKKTVRRSQTHLRLEFETKLGMNSPF